MEVYENYNEFSNDEIEMIKEQADLFFDKFSNKTNKIMTRDLVFEIYLTLFISIQINNKFEFYEKSLTNFEDKAKNLYDDLLNLKKENFTSTNLKKKIFSKYDYYEKAFKIRTKLQNCYFDYHKLKKSTSSFIQAREITKIQYEYINKNGIGNIKCDICGMKWLHDPKEECPVCHQDNDLSMFISLSMYFHILGDMQTFYKRIPKETLNILLDNWDFIKKFIQRETHLIDCTLFNRDIQRWGKEQYKKIVKPHLVDDMEESIFKLNRDHNLAVLSNAIELDLSKATNTNTDYFFNNLNRCEFLLCEKIKFNTRIDISKFKPNMPELIEIKAENCYIKKINLDPNYFPKLRRLYIRDNEIKDLDDIQNILKIKSLKLIDITHNSFEISKDFWKFVDQANDQGIEIRYDYRLRAVNRNKIDEESDPSIQKILANIPPDSESEIVSSLK